MRLSGTIGPIVYYYILSLSAALNFYISMTSRLVCNLLFFHYSSSPLRVAFRLGAVLNMITTTPATTIRPVMRSISVLNKLDGFTHLRELFLQKTLLYGINMLLNKVTQVAHMKGDLIFVESFAPFGWLIVPYQV